MDGTTGKEPESIDWLARIIRENEPAASRLLDMPFMESFEPEDALALQALHSSDYHGKLNDILDQPVFRDGISNADIPLVAFGAFIARRGGDTDTMERILAPGYTDIETASIGTELSPHLKASIVRTGTEHQPWVMEAIIDAVGLLEGMMGIPLPVGHVVMSLSHESACACTWGFAFGAPFEWGHEEDTPGGQLVHIVIVHELFHTYIYNAEWWLYEGTARNVEYIYGVEFGLDPQAYRNPRGGCVAHDIQMLAEWDISPGSKGWNCVYYLSGRLFRELLGELGFEEYGNRLRELYLIQQAQQNRGRLGIAEVRQVFFDQSEIVEKHWSGKLNAPENRLWDEDLSQNSHNLIQWDQHPAYDGDYVTFSGTLLGNAVLSSGTVEEAENDGYQNFHLYPIPGLKFGGNVFPPSWDWDMKYPGDTVALEYRLEGRTFTVKFRFPKSLGDPSGYIVDVWGFQDESRTPVIWPDRDRLGYARIRTE